MRCICVFALLSLAAAADPNYDKQWRDFKETYGKAFIGEEEESRRFDIFKKNIDIINEYNAQNLSFQLGVNEFAHLDPDEFAANYFGLKKPEKMWGDLPNLGTHVYSGKPLADSVDWSTKGAVTPIKNQAQCGSCWAFSTTGSLEGAWEIKTQKLVSLSEQQFVDCDKVDSGCGGGLMDNAFKYAEKNAICTEASYRYTAKNGKCKASSCTVGIPKGGVTGYKDVEKDNTNALMEAVAQQPVSIAIEADKSVFQLYKKGVLTGKCGSKLDHGVLAVGYGTLGGKDYWKVKNSWGASWGMNGYVLMSRGKANADKGECGILSGPPSYPVVSGKPGPSPGPSPPTPPAPPTPPGPAPGKPHYEKPPCQSGEVEASVQGAGGEVCAPPCPSGTCPTDVPTGTTAKPQCVLQDASTGKKYCALLCQATSACPTGAKCAKIGPAGICVYPTSREAITKVLELKEAVQPSSPTPPAPPAPPAKAHYEKPPCQSGEVDASVQGAGGEVCAPPCPSGTCPTDVPTGTTAKPQCVLQDASTGKKYCALLCQAKSACPKGAKCAKIGPAGICVYPTSREVITKVLQLEAGQTSDIINI